MLLRTGRSVLPLIVVVSALTLAAAVEAADIRVYTSGAPAAVQRALGSAFTRASGHRVDFTAATIDKILQALKSDAKPDVVVLPVPALGKLEKAGMFLPGSQAVLARVGIGIAVRDGATRPDVSTADALRKALLAAKSIVHPNPKGGGFAGAHIDRVFERLGIANAVRPKVVHMFAFAGGVEAVAKGDVELGLFNMSEIVPVSGVTLAGPLPAELQSYITFAGAVAAGSAVPEPAAAYLRFLIDPDNALVWQKGGFELLGPAR